MSTVRMGALFVVGALAFLTVATPLSVADGPVPVGCVNFALSTIGRGLQVIATLNNVIGLGFSTDGPGEGVLVAAFIVPSACAPGPGGVPSIDQGVLIEALAAATPLLPLP